MDTQYLFKKAAFEWRIVAYVYADINKFFSLFSLWLCVQTLTLARLVVQIRARLIHSHMALALPLLSVWLKLYALPIL